MKEIIKGYQVLEFSRTGGCHPISKVFPTWLGAKRVCNRIACENRDLVGYRYTLGKVY